MRLHGKTGAGRAGRRIGLWTAGAAALALAAAGCGSSGPSSGSGPITIGISVSLSGDFSGDGLATK
ncbi:MAG: hypothetical protein J2P29_17075, partial [Actinobacteria bacterium]|nr:hypothetical protein [Actinomycetota bacterium]